MPDMLKMEASFRPCQWLNRISRPSVLVVLIVLYLVFVLLLFPALGGGSGAVPLDLMFSYSPGQAYSMIGAYGPEVRHSYAISAMTLDVAYPLTYSLLFSVWLTLLLKSNSRIACVIRMLPFVILIFDLLENSGIVAMLVNYPQRLEMIATATSAATSLKWVFAATVIILTLGISLYRLVGILLRRLKRNESQKLT